MITYKPFDIILVPFPFADLSTQKKRPTLVLSQIDFKKTASLVVCAMITSQIQGEKLTGDVILKNWLDAGLPLASKARLAKIVTLENRLILKKIGKLSSVDHDAIQKAFAEVFPKLV